MVRIITPGVSTKYTNTCPHCMCVYEYEENDVLHGYGLTTTENAYIMCPYCGRRNNIYTRIPYNPYPYEYTKIYCNKITEQCECNCNYQEGKSEKIDV